MISTRTAKSILSRAAGFASAYDFTLNPYSGCAFGCTYCYAAFFAPTLEQKDTWGQWVTVKANAVALLRKKRSLEGRTIYMSSVTDSYQPIEKQVGLTRALLAELLNHPGVCLVIQTRSPLVTRDLDLLTQFDFVRVNMTVTTDDEDVRKAFEPTCPSNAQRLDAIAEVAAAGVDTCITMTPLLPVRDPASFAKSLRATGVPRFVVQNFHRANRRFVAGTGEAATRLLAERNWTDTHYAHVKAELVAHLTHLDEGREGFDPGWEK